MHTVAVLNQKGGSGKTATSVNIAAAIGRAGRQRVLVIDLDPQGSATGWLGGSMLGDESLEAVKGRTPLAPLIQPTSAKGVHLLAASEFLMLADRQYNPKTNQEQAFRTSLRALQGLFDLVLIDCPPTLNVLALTALIAADSVLIPVEASSMAMRGLSSLMDTIGDVRDVNPGLKVLGILPCRIDARTSITRDVIQTLREHFPRELLKTGIRETVRMKEAPLYKQSILDSAPTSTAAEDYREAAKEITKRLRRIT